MKVINNLIINNQNFKDNYGFDLDNMNSNLEAIACNNEQTYILVNHFHKNYTFYNYNKELYSLLGSNLNKLDNTIFFKYLNDEVYFKIKKYIDVANNHFIDKSETDKCYYFTINYEYGDYGSESGFTFKLVPILYTEEKCLYATLCMIKKSRHTGRITLEKFNTGNSSEYIYDDKLKSFVKKTELELSDKEREVLVKSGEGKKEKKIAEELNVSLSRLKQIKSIIYDKLKVKSISEAIFVAYKKGYIK